MSESLLACEGLTKRFGGLVALDGLAFQVGVGEIVGLVGPNGSGKTTLIRSIVGLGRAAGADIRFGATQIAGLATHKIAALGIATVAEGNRVFPKMSVLDNLRVGAIRELDEAKTRRKLDDVFSLFPRLGERRDQYAGTLSGGERSMLSIGRGLMTDPELMIFDEPSLGLSPLFVGEVFKIVRRLKESGMTILLVEQNVRQTLDVADFGYVLAQGRVTASGPPVALMQNPELRKAYFG